MAEILFKAVDAIHADPDKDARGTYKRGDVIVIKENNCTWGNKESLPPAQGGKFVIVKITDATVEDIEQALSSRWGISLLDPEIDGNGLPIRRRCTRLLVDSLPSAVRVQLNQTGTYTTDWATVKSFIQNKATMETI